MPFSSSPDPSDNYGGAPQGRWSGQPSDNPLDGWVDSADTARSAGSSGASGAHGVDDRVGTTRAYDYGYQQAQPGQSGQYSYPGYQGAQGSQGAPGYGSYNGYPADYGYPGYNAYGMPPKSQKTKVAAALFAFFLGGTGAHNFYIGNTGRGIAQAVILVVSWVAVFGGYGMIFAGTESEMVTTYSGSYYYNDDEGLIIAGIVMLLVSSVVMFSLWIWTIVEFIMILASSGRYARDKDGRILS